MNNERRNTPTPEEALRRFSRECQGISGAYTEEMKRLAFVAKSSIRRLSSLVGAPCEVTFADDKAPVLILDGRAYLCPDREVFQSHREHDIKVAWVRMNNEEVINFCRKIAEGGEKFQIRLTSVRSP